MNKIFSIIFFIGLIMTGAQSFITGAHAQCYNCVVEKKSSTEPESEGEDFPMRLKGLTIP